MNIIIKEEKAIGTKVYTAIDGVYAGCLIISDEIKPDSRVAVVALKAKGVRKTIMLTGDNPRIAGAVAETMVSGNMLEMLFNVSGVSAETDCGGGSVIPWIAFNGVVISGK